MSQENLMQENPKFDLFTYNCMSPGLNKFLYLPPHVRSRILGVCLMRAKEDADYFLSEGKSLSDFAPGIVLPSGNTVMQDEKGSYYIEAPISPILMPQDLI